MHLGISLFSHAPNCPLYTCLSTIPLPSRYKKRSRELQAEGGSQEKEVKPWKLHFYESAGHQGRLKPGHLPSSRRS